MFRLALLCFAMIAVQSPSPAMAQSAADDVVAGLTARFRAQNIRERRLADDREERIIDDYEARLALARKNYQRGLAGANSALRTARKQYQDYVARVAAHDTELRLRLEAYRGELRQLVLDATPEKLAALQQFSDGERVKAWPVLEALRAAEDAAMEAAANMRRAVIWREAAGLRQIMLEHGEASSQDVLLLWEKAAQLDPTELWTQTYLSRLYSRVGRPEASRAASRRVIAITLGPEAASDPCKATIDIEVRSPQDLKFETFLGLERAVEISKEERAWDKALCLIDMKLKITRGWEALLRPHVASDNDLVVPLRNISRELLQRAGVHRAMNALDLELADAMEADRIRERISAIDPSDEAKLDLSFSHLALFDIYRGRGDIETAGNYLTKGYNIAAEVAKANPRSIRATRQKLSGALGIIVFSSDPGVRVDAATMLAMAKSSVESLRMIALADPTQSNTELYVKNAVLFATVFDRWKQATEATILYMEVLDFSKKHAVRNVGAHLLTAEFRLAERKHPSSSWVRVRQMLERIKAERPLTDEEKLMEEKLAERGA